MSEIVKDFGLIDILVKDKASVPSFHQVISKLYLSLSSKSKTVTYSK